ncbi:RluA family pseudouridine synthase [Bremerella alba]|uniref:RluA family pseudouridine synthase n=1 Tax=Bremerella alba TaxID=980252 RepID=UPI001A954AA2|nr:RluA family pseudouridine synthase [Bremerella alba]
MEVLYEDNHLIAIMKPPGLPTMGVSEGETSAVTQVKAYLKQKYDKPGNVYLGVVSRLDSMVTGVLLFARTSKAAKRLNEQFRERTTTKTYRAIVAGNGIIETGQLADWIRKDEKNHRMIASRHQTAGGQKGELLIESVEAVKAGYHLTIKLITGRKHQIRVQLASRRVPILGDRKYGSSIPFPAGIALHAAELIIEHPVSKQKLTLIAPIPAIWHNFL